jgi:shikimate 5-dehydrogenase
MDPTFIPAFVAWILFATVFAVTEHQIANRARQRAAEYAKRVDDVVAKHNDLVDAAIAFRDRHDHLVNVTGHYIAGMARAHGVDPEKALADVGFRTGATPLVEPSGSAAEAIVRRETN